LKVVTNINTIPPTNITNIDAFDNNKPLTNSKSGTINIDTLTINNIKYQTQNRLLKHILEYDQPLYLHFKHTFEIAREFIKSTD
jgi:hypothetical protein